MILSHQSIASGFAIIWIAAIAVALWFWKMKTFSPTTTGTQAAKVQKIIVLCRSVLNAIIFITLAESSTWIGRMKLSNASVPFLKVLALTVNI